MDLSKVSIIIPNYNYAKFIAQAIDSALVQTYPNKEIIVVDDGSTDGSREVIEKYGDKIKAVFQTNQGVSVTRNNAVAESTGEIIAFLDADDIWFPNKLEKQIPKFAESKKVKFVHCSMILINPDGEPIGVESSGQEGSVAEEFLLFKRGVVIGAASTGVVTRAVFDELGGFDIRLSTAADWDFCYRLATKYDVGFVNEPLALYRMHNSNMHGNIKVMEHDMMIGFEKAFSGITTVKPRHAYGNLHKTLAGAYFQRGEYKDFVRHALSSILKKPSNVGYFAEFPIRRIRSK